MPGIATPSHPPGAPRCRSALPLLALLLFLQACHPRPAAVPPGPSGPIPLQDPAWFGEPARLAPHPRVDFAWAAPGLDLKGRPVELGAWEVPAAPPPGAEPGEAWKADRERITQVLQTLTAEGIALAQQMKVPGGEKPTCRIQGRVLAFDRRARVAAKAGQVAGNLVLVPVNVALLLLSNGNWHHPLFISGVSGYRTEALFQVKAVDLGSGRTILAIQDWVDFKSLEAPTSLLAAIWSLSGGEAVARAWWSARDLRREAGDEVWFMPGLDLRQARIRCLRWLPDESLEIKVGERALEAGLQATRMPRMLAGTDHGEAGPFLSETEGTLHLQGEAEPGSPSICRVKLWDPATGQVLGLMRVAKGFWRSDVEKDWVRRIRMHLRGQKGAAAIP